MWWVREAGAQRGLAEFEPRVLVSCDMLCLNSCHVSNHGMRCLHYIPLARFHTHSYKKNECDNIKFAVVGSS